MRVQVSCVLGDEEAVEDNLWEIAKRDRGILRRLCEYKCMDVIEGKACVDGRKYACSAVTKRDTVLWVKLARVYFGVKPRFFVTVLLLGMVTVAFTEL